MVRPRTVIVMVIILSKLTLVSLKFPAKRGKIYLAGHNWQKGSMGSFAILLLVKKRRIERGANIAMNKKIHFIGARRALSFSEKVM
ncbi:MAG: hypothetical protein WAW67_04230 [Candidatus Omnitrophota bacterium]